jgi:hypothetical protein
VIWQVVLGAILALVGGLVTQVYVDRRRARAAGRLVHAELEENVRLVERYGRREASLNPRRAAWDAQGAAVATQTNRDLIDALLAVYSLLDDAATRARMADQDPQEKRPSPEQLANMIAMLKDSQSHLSSLSRESWLERAMRWPRRRRARRARHMT